MTTVDAAKSGSFKIGGDLAVHRLGFGAMRVTGKGIWGEPEDRAEALRTLRRVPELGVNLIDTADSYGPEVSERLIREALHPYDGLVIATKGGLLRPGPDRWVPCGKPEYLRHRCPSACASSPSSVSTSGSCTASIPAFRAMSSSPPSPPCRRRASFATSG